MWFYIGIAVTTLTLLTQDPRRVFNAGKDLGKMIYREGPSVCIEWVRKLMTNQLGNRCIEMHHKYYIIEYPYGVSWYKIVVPRRRGPSKIAEICNEWGRDVKEEILPFMGPSHNFHGLAVTPSQLGYNELTFTDLVGDKRTFRDTEPIKL